MQFLVTLLRWISFKPDESVWRWWDESVSSHLVSVTTLSRIDNVITAVFLFFHAELNDQNSVETQTATIGTLLNTLLLVEGEYDLIFASEKREWEDLSQLHPPSPSQLLYHKSAETQAPGQVLYPQGLCVDG